MEPLVEPSSRPRGLMDRLVLVIMIALILVAVGLVTLLSLYMGRMSEAAAGLPRVGALPSYPGRPSAVIIGDSAPLNFLVMTTSARDGTLSAVMIGHLSASRRNFTLVGLPDDLEVTTPDGGSATLAETYRTDPALTVRMVEHLTGTRMDHQIHLDLVGFIGVVDALEGLEMPPTDAGNPAGSRLRDGREAKDYVDSAPDSIDRVDRTMDVVRATLVRLSRANVITDPGRFDAVMDALIPCVMVDADLTASEVEATAMELRVRGDRVATLRLATTPGAGGQVADPGHLGLIAEALAADRIDALATGRGMASATTEPPR